jgi:hypothetical protein
MIPFLGHGSAARLVLNNSDTDGHMHAFARAMAMLRQMQQQFICTGGTMQYQCNSGVGNVLDLKSKI